MRVEAGDKEWWCLPKPQEGNLADGQISVTRQPGAGRKRSLRVMASCQSLWGGTFQWGPGSKL